MEKYFENLKFKLMGAYWVERTIAKRMEKAGYTVYRNFMVYDPRADIEEKKRYGEIDVLALDFNQVIICEAKSWAGQWYARDELKFKRWFKEGRKKGVKSPVWQTSRARSILIRVLLAYFFKKEHGILAHDHIKTYVVLDRGEILNIKEHEVHKAWKKEKIQVQYLKDFSAPESNRQFPEGMKPYLEAYQEHWKRCWYIKFLQKVEKNNKSWKWPTNYKNKFLEKKQKQWEKVKAKISL